MRLIGCKLLEQVRPSVVRYIKLGPGGAWLRRCVQDGFLELGHGAIPHDVAAQSSREGLARYIEAQGRAPGKAKDFAREIADFYQLGDDCLWITIGDGRLWWCFAGAEVAMVSEEGRGARARRVIGAWQDCDVNGEPLSLSSLSTRLTKVAAYRQTLCRVEAEDYLLRRINALVDPAVERAKRAQAETIASAAALIERLDWRDFEVLVDLIFAGSGWKRSSGVGGSDQADTDLVLEQAVTGERAFVQVKSRANAAVFADYVERFRASSGFDRFFFICHSPSGTLPCDHEPDVHVWLGEHLAEQAARAGLLGWLIEKAR